MRSGQAYAIRGYSLAADVKARPLPHMRTALKLLLSRLFANLYLQAMLASPTTPTSVRKIPR